MPTTDADIRDFCLGYRLKVDSTTTDGNRLPCHIVAKIRDEKLPDLGNVVGLSKSAQRHL